MVVVVAANSSGSGREQQWQWQRVVVAENNSGIIVCSLVVPYDAQWSCAGFASCKQEGRNDSSAQCRGKINVSVTYCYILLLYGTQANVSRERHKRMCPRHKRMCPVNMYIWNCFTVCTLHWVRYMETIPIDSVWTSSRHQYQSNGHSSKGQ